MSNTEVVDKLFNELDTLHNQVDQINSNYIQINGILWISIIVS